MGDKTEVADPLAQVLTPRAALQSAVLDGELVVFDNTSRVFHRLNPTATAVWIELDGETTLGTIADVLADRYGVDPTVIVEDISHLAVEFDDQRLLETSESPEPPGPPWVPALEPSASTLTDRHDSLVAAGPWAVSGGPYSAFGFRFALVCDDDEVGAHVADTLAPLAEDGDASWPRLSSNQAVIRTYLVRRPRSDPAADEPAEERSGNPIDPAPSDDDNEPPVPEPAAPVHSTANRWRFFLGGRHVQSTGSASGMVDHLFWHVNRMATETDSAHTMFHAAGASWAGAGILMPGQQNAGKSTLVTGLVAAGLGYLGDEAIALHSETAWMLPFHKSIGLDRGSWPLFAEFEPEGVRAGLQPTRWHVPPDRVRPGSRAPSAPVRFIVCPQYQQDAETSLEPMSDIDAVALLLEQAFHLADRPDALEQLVSVVKEAECRRLIVSDLAESVRLVCELVGAPS